MLLNDDLWAEWAVTTACTIAIIVMGGGERGRKELFGVILGGRIKFKTGVGACQIKRGGLYFIVKRGLASLRSPMLFECQ